jgi:hypothetical protein
LSKQNESFGVENSMITIPNDKKIPASIVFVNLATLFTSYCTAETNPYILHYKRHEDTITITLDSEDIMDIIVSDHTVQIKKLIEHGHLTKASETFIYSLVA